MREEMLRVLREVYEAIGPTGVPVEELAPMTHGHVDTKWDFVERHIAHRVAIAIVKYSKREP